MAFDFGGWATRNDLKCTDGRTIRRDAFKHNDGATVPLVWNHQHNEVTNVLGHAMLENRDEGVYARCSLNDTLDGIAAKKAIEHGDIRSLSIYANQLKQIGGDVIHGEIRELSLVLAGANPGAFIDSVIKHGDEFVYSESEGYMFFGEGDGFDLFHGEEDGEDFVDDKKEVKETEPVNDLEEVEESTEDENIEDGEDAGETKEPEDDESIEHADETVASAFNSMSESQQEAVLAMVDAAEDNGSVDESVKKAFDSMNETQRKAAYGMVAAVLDGKNSEGGSTNMKHNVFDSDVQGNGAYLSHADAEVIIDTAKKCGSLRDAVEFHMEEGVLAHAVTDEDGNEVNYGVANIDYLFPEARYINNTPDFIKREDAWVSRVMQGTKHTPFSRVKSIHANITGDDARARGYIKGNLKEEEVFPLLRRTTTPTTIYKKQKLDRDDIIDITDFDIVSWLKSEMRMMLDEEIARAILIGDGRSSVSQDKIDETHIRPIWTDHDLYTVKKALTWEASDTDSTKAKKFIKQVIKAMKDYKGSGNPVLFTSQDLLTDMLLIEDGQGRDLYESPEKLKTKLQVSDIITVPQFESLTRTADSYTYGLMGIVVNLNDYVVGADKGGAVGMFEDFDIDYNQEKYLIETRCSGALVKPYSAIVIESKTAAAQG